MCSSESNLLMRFGHLPVLSHTGQMLVRIRFNTAKGGKSEVLQCTGARSSFGIAASLHWADMCDSDGGATVLVISVMLRRAASYGCRTLKLPRLRPFLFAVACTCNRFFVGSATHWIPPGTLAVPSTSRSSILDIDRCGLPIWCRRRAALDAIRASSVTVSSPIAGYSMCR